MAIVHVWMRRARCPSCSRYLWTTPGSARVVCCHAAASILDDEPIVGDPVEDEADFAAAVAADLGLDVADLDLQHEAP